MSMFRPSPTFELETSSFTDLHQYATQSFTITTHSRSILYSTSNNSSLWINSTTRLLTYMARDKNNRLFDHVIKINKGELDFKYFTRIYWCGCMKILFCRYQSQRFTVDRIVLVLHLQYCSVVLFVRPTKLSLLHKNSLVVWQR